MVILVTFLILIGLFSLFIGLSMRSGKFKAFYLIKGTPVLMPIAIRNMYIPLGVMFLVWGVSMSNLVPKETGRWMFEGPVTLLMLISIVLGVWNPRWLRPQWLNYLEGVYGMVMWKLLDEAKKDVRSWSRRVNTQAGLEEWAEETRIKLGYPPHPDQIERMAEKQEQR